MGPTAPAHYDILTDEDKAGYQELRKSLQSAFSLAPRSSKISDSFESVVEQLRRYIICGDASAELRRSLVCGIMWIDNVVAINTRQLCIIVGKCKSSVNSGLQAIGYTTIPTDANTATALTKAFPFMKSDFGEMRQWTFRLMPVTSKDMAAYEPSNFSPPPDDLPLSSHFSLDMDGMLEPLAFQGQNLIAPDFSLDLPDFDSLPDAVFFD